MPSLAEYSRGTATEKTVQTLLFSATLPAWIQVCGVHPRPFCEEVRADVLVQLYVLDAMLVHGASLRVSFCGMAAPTCVWHCCSYVRVALSLLRACGIVVLPCVCGLCVHLRAWLPST